jgi:hypothetical protein
MQLVVMVWWWLRILSCAWPHAPFAEGRGGGKAWSLAPGVDNQEACAMQSCDLQVGYDTRAMECERLSEQTRHQRRVLYVGVLCTSHVQTSCAGVWECSSILRLKKPCVEMFWCTGWPPKKIVGHTFRDCNSCTTYATRFLHLESTHCSTERLAEAVLHVQWARHCHHPWPPANCTKQPQLHAELRNRPCCIDCTAHATGHG